MAADWSQLPKELIHLISEKIDSELYLVRFRSVCSSQRSSSIPKHPHSHYLSLNIPQCPSNNYKNPNPVCHLYKHSIFLIKPPHHHHRPWLIRIGPDPNGKIQLWHPFTLHPRPPFRFPQPLFHFPQQHVLDFNQLFVLELGHMFLLSNPNSHKYSKKVLVATCQDKQQPLFMATFNYTGGLTMFRCGDESWTNMSSMTTSFFGDICLFKGKTCAVDYSGETVMFEPDLSYHLIAESLPEDEDVHKKFLLQSECELLLVDCYVVDGSVVFTEGDDHLRIVDDGSDFFTMGDDHVRIVVFKLDENEKKWVKLTSLGDRVLFLGNGITFSAYASELGSANGNCVIYTDDAFTFIGLKGTKCGMGVFHLDQNQASPLSDYPDYLKLFRPPPEWISELQS